MKLQQMRILTAILPLILGVCVSIQGQTVSGSLPALSGTKAIEYLKQNRQYDSLIEAFEATRKGQTDETPSEDAFEQTAKLTAADGAGNDRFGLRIAISGDTAIVGALLADVGANTDQGSAYIFVRSGTTWSVQQKLTAADGAAADVFGGSVAISGETVIVGAWSDQVGANIQQGSAYIFVRSGTIWSEKQKLTASDGVLGDVFGYSVGISGETAIVGAYGDDVGANNSQGSAYVFVRSGTTWSQQQKLTASDGSVEDQFGIRVAISGETAIVGAYIDDVGANANQGSAYIFVRSGTMWNEQQKLTASDGEANEAFGYGVAISGETAIVGAFGDDLGENNNQGSAYVFVRSGSTWSQQQQLTASDGEADDEFGSGVAISGETAIVGALHDAVGANNSQGSAYIFVRSGTTWSQQQKLTASDGSVGDNFGISVAISGKTAIVGAWFDNVGANTDQGSAYVFRVMKAPFDFDGDGKTDIGIFRPASAEWWYTRSSDNQVATAQFGATTDIITPADCDGDGKTDIAVFRDGTWWWINSGNSTVAAAQFGMAGDIPVPADYTDDGRDELAVYRNGQWWALDLSQPQSSLINFGLATDKPVAADYDGDGRVDQAVYRNGEWHINRSSLGYTVIAFGLSSDRPVVGDYDGDGHADLGVYRNGTWYLQQSTAGFRAFQWGLSTDIPTPADYDGDGKTDAAVFRNGTWYLLQSTGGIAIQQFGLADDKPVPSAFIPSL